MKDFRPKNPEKFKGKNKIQLNKFHQQVQKKKGVNIKKKIRDLERLINKEGLNEEIKAAKQKELEALKNDHQKEQTVKKRMDRKEMIFEQKYKKVKSVEETKVRRMIKKVEKQINENPTEELRLEKKSLLDKLSYIKNFPKDKKYLSLFPSNEDEKMINKRNEIMEEILKQVAKKQQFYEKIDLDDDQQNEKQNIIPKQRQAGQKHKQKDDFFTLEEQSESSDIEQEEQEDDDQKQEKKQNKIKKSKQQKPIKKKIVDKKGNIIEVE